MVTSKQEVQNSFRPSIISSVSKIQILIIVIIRLLYIVEKRQRKYMSQGSGPSRDYWLGRLRHEDFINDPKTYITTVGLYNENNELVAVAKLSVPILKSFDTETLIKVKLDF